MFLISLEGFVIPLDLDRLQAQRPGDQPRRQDPLRLGQRRPPPGVDRRAGSATDGKVADRKVIHDFGNRRGIDGMTVTTDGRIVAAAGAGDKAGVYVFSPDGKLLEVIPTPEDPANVEFGGDDGKTLYICAGRASTGSRPTMTGFRLWPPSVAM